MTINLITLVQYAQLLNIVETNPTLTYQNKGYDTISKELLTDNDKEAIKEIEAILKGALNGFSSFTNFRLNKDGEIQIRLQYDYHNDKNGITFIGVGYILLDELYKGFRN